MSKPSNQKQGNTPKTNHSPEKTDNNCLIADAIERLRKDYESECANNGAQYNQTLRWQKWTTWGVAIYTILTFVLVCISKCSLDTARDTEIKQFRAYVHAIPMQNANLGMAKDAAIVVRVKPKIKVFGLTPASMVVVPWRLKVLPWPLTTIPMDYIPANRQFKSSITIGPNEERDVDEKSITLTREDADSINRGSKRIVEYGTILYNDVFRQGRWTNFCISFTIAEFDKGGEVCAIHNDTDWSNPGYPSYSYVRVPMD